MRFSIQKKVTLLGVVLSTFLIGIAFLVSFLVFQNNAKKNLINSVDSSVEELETRLSTLEKISQLNMITSYLLEHYEPIADDPVPEFKSYKEEYDYYYSIYENVYFKPNPGTMGLPMQYEKTYIQENSSVLRDAVISSRGIEAYICYKDQKRNRLIYIVDSKFDFHEEYLGAGHLFGEYYQLTDSDIKTFTEGEMYKEYDWDNKKTRSISIYDDDNNQAYVATIFIEYSEQSVIEQLRSFFAIEGVALGIALVVMIIIYVLLARFFLVKHILKLNNSTKKFTDNLLEEKQIEIIDPNVKAKDEVGDLSDSFVILEKEILNYTEKIKNDAIEKERLNAELNVASKIQMSSLPSNHINDKYAIIDSLIVPAKEVGGDFYDYFYVDDNNLAIIISDVSGKGIPASLFMMKAKELIRSKMLINSNLEDVCYNVNNLLLENNEANLFITAFIGIIDLENKELRFVNCGHEKPYIIGKEIKRIECQSNFILGGMNDFKYKEEKIKLNDNDKLFLFTDGLNESINNSNEEFGYDRILKSLEINKNEQIHNIIHNMKRDLDSFTENRLPFDDITILIIELKNEKLYFHYEKPTYEIIDEITNKFNDYYSYVDKNILSKIDIIFDELLNNFISYEDKDNLIIDVNISFKNELVIEFVNNGVEFNPLTKKQEQKEIGGYGINIIKSFVDDISYERKDNKNIITIKKKI